MEMHYLSSDSRQNTICKYWDIFNMSAVLYAFGATFWVDRENYNRVVISLHKIKTKLEVPGVVTWEVSMIPVSSTVRTAEKGLFLSECNVMCKGDVQMRSRKETLHEKCGVGSDHKGSDQRRGEAFSLKGEVLGSYSVPSRVSDMNRAAWLLWKIWVQNSRGRGWKSMLWPNCGGVSIPRNKVGVSPYR